MADCPLCGHASCFYHQDKQRVYRRCEQCSLVFVPQHYHLLAEQEKAVYDLHENKPDDPAYRQFLARLFDSMVQCLPVSARGLDFGCGAGPALQQMFAEQGFDVALYDIYYHPHRTVLDEHYDFITLTEVIEHLSEPDKVLQQLWQQLNPHGLLGIMTKLVLSPDAFSRWHYKNDPTHVCFYSEQTLDFLAMRLNAHWRAVADDAFIFFKSP